jgi:DHA1 family multidrug resistance protein-like MFS transporter
MFTVSLHFIFLDNWLSLSVPHQVCSTIMAELFRESPVGQIIRFITKNKFLKYSEEKDGFQCPSSYARRSTPTSDSSKMPDIAEKLEDPTSPESLASPATLADSDLMNEASKTSTRNSLDAEALRRLTSRVDMEKVTTRRDLERAYTDATQRGSLKRGPTQPIIPEKTADGIVLVDWYNTDDQDNPQNWSFKKKAVVATQI